MTKKHQQSGRLGAALRTARRTAGLSQTALADRAGLSRAAVIQSESGRGRLDTITALAAVLDLGIEGKGLPPGGGSLGARLAALRAVRGYSRRALAERAEVSIPTVAAIEYGADTVLIAPVERLAGALGASLALVPVGAAPVAWFRSSAYDAWTTPPDLARALAEAVGGAFDLDVASPGPADSPIPAEQHYTAADDGLTQAWHGIAYMNPPYGSRNLAQWIGKAVAEVEAGRAHMVVALIPANTDTTYWHRHVEGCAQYRRFLRGRLAFGGAANGAPFGSAVVVWGGTAGDHARVDAALDRWQAARRHGSSRQAA